MLAVGRRGRIVKNKLVQIQIMKRERESISESGRRLDSQKLFHAALCCSEWRIHRWEACHDDTETLTLER